MSDAPSPCIRGCLRFRQHATDCPGDECPGCLPREAQHGLLCYGCHSRLRNLLQAAHGQWALLLVTAGKSSEQVLSAETTAKPHRNPRTSSDAKFPGPFASVAATHMSMSEPVRIAALDSAQALADWLSQAVEIVVTEANLSGPRPLRTGETDRRTVKWKPVRSDGQPTYRAEKVETFHGVKGETMAGQYVWVDPPETFAVDTAANFLLAWLDRLEAMPHIGDTIEELHEVMSQAHALAPWREQVARLKGIPCPECHRAALVRYGGDEDVTCLKCRATMGPARYAIWTKMLAEQEGA